jgi:hypothetical protein
MPAGACRLGTPPAARTLVCGAASSPRAPAPQSGPGPLQKSAVAAGISIGIPLLSSRCGIAVARAAVPDNAAGAQQGQPFRAPAAATGGSGADSSLQGRKPTQSMQGPSENLAQQLPTSGPGSEAALSDSADTAAPAASGRQQASGGGQGCRRGVLSAPGAPPTAFHTSKRVPRVRTTGGAGLRRIRVI